MHKKHAIIIGTGPAGLTAAYYFAKFTDIKPIVLEKENFVGGLARTMNFSGNRLDIGGHKFFSKHEEVLKVWNELLPEEEKIFLTHQSISRIFYQQKFFSYPISLNFNVIKNLGLMKTFSIGTSFIKAKLNKRDEITLEDSLINRFGQKLYETFFREYTIKVWGRSPQEINANSGAEKILGLGLNENPPVEEIFYPKHGSVQMWEKMVDEIKKIGGEVLTSTNVKSFHVVNNVIKSVRVESPAGMLTFPADYFVSSMPLAELAEALDDGLPLRPLMIARGLIYRDFITVGLLVDKLTLGDIIPYCQISIYEPSVKLSRLQIFNNWSPNMVAAPKNSVWLGLEYFCNEGDELWQMSDNDFIKFAADELASIGIIDAMDVRFGVRVKVPKAYPTYFDTYENISELRGALDEIKNLYCIGRNGQHCNNNMDNSMLTAIAAVCAIIGKFSKADVWKVNYKF